TVALTGMLIGGVTIFGLPADMPIWVDSRVLGRERVIVGGGNRSSKVIVRPDELRKLPDLEFVEDLAVLPSP
ncbi:MAG: YbaK/EbsC family protein, partial [Dehalococcoidia bacterium]